MVFSIARLTRAGFCFLYRIYHLQDSYYHDNHFNEKYTPLLYSNNFVLCKQIKYYKLDGVKMKNDQREMQDCSGIIVKITIAVKKLRPFKYRWWYCSSNPMIKNYCSWVESSFKSLANTHNAGSSYLCNSVETNSRGRDDPIMQCGRRKLEFEVLWRVV